MKEIVLNTQDLLNGLLDDTAAGDYEDVQRPLPESTQTGREVPPDQAPAIQERSGGLGSCEATPSHAQTRASTLHPRKCGGGGLYVSTSQNRHAAYVEIWNGFYFGMLQC
jgi:hypothetical protein